MRQRPLNRKEQSAQYGRLIDPRPSFATIRDANGQRAQTAWEREQIEARKRKRKAVT